MTRQPKVKLPRIFPSRGCTCALTVIFRDGSRRQRSADSTFQAYRLSTAGLTSHPAASSSSTPIASSGCLPTQQAARSLADRWDRCSSRNKELSLSRKPTANLILLTANFACARRCNATETRMRTAGQLCGRREGQSAFLAGGGNSRNHVGWGRTHREARRRAEREAIYFAGHSPTDGACNRQWRSKHP